MDTASDFVMVANSSMLNPLKSSMPNAKIKIIEPMNTVGERVRGLRKKRGWSQTKLGGQVGVSKSAISYIESDTTHFPRPETLFGLARVFGVDPGWLITGKPFYQTSESELAPLVDLLRNMTPEKRQLAGYLLSMVHDQDHDSLDLKAIGIGK